MVVGGTELFTTREEPAGFLTGHSNSHTGLSGEGLAEPAQPFCYPNACGMKESASGSRSYLALLNRGDDEE